MKKRSLKPIEADLILVLVTMWWGISYVGIDYCLEDTSPLCLNAWRFLLGAAIVLPFGYRRIMANLNAKSIKYGIIVGITLCGTYWGATYGIKYTNITNAGFLCGLAVVITPIINRLLGNVLDKKTRIAIIMCFIGVCLLTLKEGFAIDKSSIKGDLLCIMCSVFYALNIIQTENAVKKEGIDAYTLGVIELVFVGIINLVLSLVFTGPYIPSNISYWASLLFLAVFCTGLAFVLQPIAQQYTSAARVGVIFTLEPVFNVAAAVLITGEHLGLRSLIGGAIMILAIIIMEFNPKKENTH